MYAYRKKNKVDSTLILATSVYMLFAGLLSHVLLHLQ